MNPIWVRYLPAFIRCRLEGQHKLQNIIVNIGWLFGDKILRMGVGLLVGVWLARYLGPAQFGQLNYALAFVALFGAVANLGQNGILVRDLVKEPETASVTLGTAFLMQIIGGLLAYSLAVMAISFAQPDGGLSRMMVSVLGMAMVFKAAEVVKTWFEAQVQSKYAVWVENCIFLILSIVKVCLILAHAPIMAFVWVILAEGILVAVGLLGVYTLSGGVLRAWRVRLDRGIILLKEGWPLILSGLTVMVYMRIDQIMLGQMLDDDAVGIYTAAVRISEVWYFIPIAVVASVFPAILEAKKLDESLYYQRLQKLYDLMVLLALAVAIPMTFLSDWLVSLLFGPSFAQAGTALAIHIWGGLFVFLGVASGNWLLAENLQRFSFYRTFWGCIVNIGANCVLIPHYGIAGAATGTILSQGVAAYLFDITNSKTRNMFWMKTKSFAPFLKYAASHSKRL